MMKLIRRIVGVLFLAMVLVTPGPAQADTANGWYLAIPAWDRQLQCDTQATCPRFLVLADWIDASNPSGGAAVMDRETGLVWETSPSTSDFTWEHAQGHCTQLLVGNRLGWRLPTIQELATLIDHTVPFPGPTLPAGHPFTNVQSAAYWSATSSATSATPAGAAWVGNFVDGGVKVVSKLSIIFDWCVRGGRGGDPQ
jgi:hypothetical protein